MVHKKKNRRFGAGFSKLWEIFLAQYVFCALATGKELKGK